MYSNSGVTRWSRAPQGHWPRSQALRPLAANDLRFYDLTDLEMTWLSWRRHCRPCHTSGYRSLVRRATGPVLTSSVTIKWTLSHDRCKRRGDSVRQSQHALSLTLNHNPVTLRTSELSPHEWVSGHHLQTLLPFNSVRCLVSDTPMPLHIVSIGSVSLQTVSLWMMRGRDLDISCHQKSSAVSVLLFWSLLCAALT